jgi:hypothetical protein
MQEGQTKYETYPLEDLYFKLKQNEKVNEQQVYFFENINTIINDVEKIFYTDIMRTIKTEDL